MKRERRGNSMCKGPEGHVGHMAGMESKPVWMELREGEHLRSYGAGVVTGAVL